MAKIYPQEVRGKSKAEQIFLEYLRLCPRTWRVYFGWDLFLKKKKKHEEKFMEADAIVVVPELGYLVIEIVGNFYQVAGNILRQILTGKYPSVHILIVSAFYGLVRLDERLKEYELQMGDRLQNGIKVYKFWQQAGLSQILQDYIFSNNISYVWSFLPDSMPHFPYHRVFSNLWKALRNTQIQCYHVQVPGAGSGIGYIRAKWLVEILRANPNFLIGTSFPPGQIGNMLKYKLYYHVC